jgi:RHS repeat-associated protein
MNAYNQYKTYTLGNGLTTTKTYDDYGFLNKIEATNSNIQNMEYDFDLENGNLKSRHDLRGVGLSRFEEFNYDNLNRLTEAKVNGTTQINTLFQSNGNISSKTDAGNYTYNGAKKNAVAKVSSQANISSFEQTITYTPFNSVEEIIENNTKLNFTYAADQQRRIMQYKNNNIIEQTTVYLGNYEEIIDAITGDAIKIHYIPGGDGLAAMHIITEPDGQAPVTETFYTYTDYLGSILTLTDESANIVYEQNFDAWGRERNADDLTYITSNTYTKPNWLTRGYTGHEHLTANGIINMNGRLYDPITARMLSPDNFVQSPLFTQSYNRYSYVINNPLKFTDPSGENWFSDRWDDIKDGWNAAWDFINGTYNPETGQNEGGLAQQVPNWVPNFSVGVNSSGQTFHTVGNSGNIYHNNVVATPGINWAEVNAYLVLQNMMTPTGIYGEELNLGGWEPKEGDLWSHPSNRVNTGDAISISIDISGVVGKGEKVKAELIFLTQGQDRFTFKPQITSGRAYGVDLSIGFQLNKYFYTGRLENFNKGTFNGYVQDIDAGYAIFDYGIGGGKDNYGNYLLGGSFGISLGLPWPVGTYSPGAYSEPWQSGW